MAGDHSMNVIYVSCAMSREKLKEYNGVQISDAAQKFNRMLAEGLAENGTDVLMLSARPITRQISRKIWIRSGKEDAGGLHYRYSSIINLPGIKNLHYFFDIFRRVLVSRTPRSNTIVICDALNFSAAAGALHAAAIRGFPTLGIVTDPNESTSPFLHLLLDLEMKSYRSYLFLTDHMTQLVNRKNRPYIVIEGFVDADSANTDPTDPAENERVCLYAGSLNRKYGIGYLLKGFLKADIPNTRLDIYGVGEFAEELKQITKEHTNVRYLGRRPNDEVIRAERNAALLINPRPSGPSYTLYTFPSKNLEYMASGTPVLTTCLPGMPEDHKPYVFLLRKENEDGLAEALKTILARPSQELRDFGEKARNYVLQNKTNIRQAGKLLSFIDETFCKRGNT